MNKKLRAFLVANGLRNDATEQEAWELYDKLKDDGIELPGVDPGQRSAVTGTPAAPAAPAAQSEPARGMSADELQAEVRRQVQAENSRQEEIRGLLEVANLSGDAEFSRSLLGDTEISGERASKMILAKLKERSAPIGGGAFAQVGTEAPEKLRAAISDGLMMRAGVRVETPAAGAREFRGRHLVEVCRELLIMGGEQVRGLDPMAIVGRALVAGSTSDFANIFSSLVNKTLLAAYTEWPATWRPFVATTGANDFKELHAIKLSGAPDLLELGENGEYRLASFSDAKESYRVITKGRTFALTRQMIINDDLRAFTRLPQLFGVAAKRMEADAVYSLITTNAAMSDSVALFHSTHKNLASPAAALSSAALGKGRMAMRKQTGLAGENIDVSPAFLLVPVALETDAEILLRSAALPDDNKSSGVHNPWAGKLTPIADPHLDDNSATAWYLMAHPNQAPTIEVAWLMGEEMPYVEEQVDFDSDALKIKVRHDFGCGVVDHVGAYKNAGA